MTPWQLRSGIMESLFYQNLTLYNIENISNNFTRYYQAHLNEIGHLKFHNTGLNICLTCVKYKHLHSILHIIALHINIINPYHSELWNIPLP